jgi:alpha-L-fucosidase
MGDSPRRRRARRRFVDYIHEHVRELCGNNRLDVLWYDVAWPLDVKGWESEKMNQLVFGLQPEIIVNNRNLLPGDFSTPEQGIHAEKAGRAWETCMTMNDSWGCQKADDNWKTPITLRRRFTKAPASGRVFLPQASAQRCPAT